MKPTIFPVKYMKKAKALIADTTQKVIFQTILSMLILTTCQNAHTWTCVFIHVLSTDIELVNIPLWPGRHKAVSVKDLDIFMWMPPLPEHGTLVIDMNANQIHVDQIPFDNETRLNANYTIFYSNQVSSYFSK